MPVYTLTIGGTPYTIGTSLYDIHAMWEISAPANGPARLAIDAVALDVSDLPQLDDEVVLSEDGSPIFGGPILELRTHGVAGYPTDVAYAQLSALDFNTLAQRRYAIALSLPAGTLKASLQVVVTLMNGVTLSGSQVDGPSLPALTYSQWTIQQVLDQLAELSGYTWNIDASKVLSMVSPGSNAAPFNLSDGDGLTVGDVVVEPTRQQYANLVTVIGDGVTAVAQDSGEISARGPWEFLVQAPDVSTQAAADALAAAVLAAHLPIVKTVEYSTHETGLEPGQTQTINLPTRGVNNTFLITEVVTRARGQVALRSVKAIEGVVYQTGWREVIKEWGGSGSGVTTAGLGGGAVGSQRYAYFLGDSGSNFPQSPTPDWVPASAVQVQINTVARGTTEATVTARLRALNSGVSVRARLFDVTDTDALEMSSIVTNTDWETVTWTVTLNAGSHYYRLELLPGTANEPVGAVAYVE